jgi:pilus assembly protein CpaE
MSIQAEVVGTAAKTDSPQFCAFVEDDESRAVVEQVVRDLVIPHAQVTRGSIRTAIKALGQKRSPKTLVVDLCKSELPLSDINELAEVCEPGVTVIAIGDRNDVGLFRELLNTGVSDYLVKPLTPTLVQRALLASADGDGRTRQTTRLGRLVATIGARGGVGATMLATSMAWTIATRRRRRVALLDLDLQFGSVALSLDLEPTHGLREALENASRIDTLYLERSMTQHSESLYVLSSEEELADDMPRDPQALSMLISELRNKFHYLIVDLPRTLTGESHEVLKEATHLVLVTDLSLVGMRDTLRLVQLAMQGNAACQITIVANRVGEYRQGEIEAAEFEKAIGRKIDLVIPFDPRSVTAAMNIGKPVASTSKSVAASVERLVDNLAGAASPQRSSLLQRLWAR